MDLLQVFTELTKGFANFTLGNADHDRRRAAC